MRVCRYNGDRLGVALVEEGVVADVTGALEVLPVVRWPPAPGDQLVRELPAVREAIERLLPVAPRVALDAVELQSPVANPSKVIGAPLNYARHQQEVGEQVAIHANTHASRFDGFATPIDKLGLFLKAGTSLVGPSAGVRLAQTGRRTDHEVELAVVIGRQAADVAPQDALGLVAGYCIGLDMTVRGPEGRSFRKSPDSYTVLGPWLVTADEVPNPDALAISLHVGDELRQRASTADLIVDVRELIALASRWYTLYPGDVILTGTPEGVGPVRAGDVMTAELEGVGLMRVPVT
ncbi:MAG TPA: fumarylacetoacetate hydrolase family protein [Conexibacter sp.]|jgi:2-keto-4-pentenoate hydratase/2-oxohepta-3-ene-1,7-dioic acid hydratase in catechol pathway|nr:fumarylacetoacetate hydrolase family protein [Conexibacter sp.]